MAFRHRAAACGIALVTGALVMGGVAPGVAAQDGQVSVAAGAHYSASGLKRVLMGSGYRNLWTLPIRLDVAPIDTLDGGLEFLRVGGGTTSATLHARGRSGRRYVFRTVDKDPLTGQLQELAGTVFGSGVRDQISAFHPFGALAVPPLADAVGVLHVRPRLYVFPQAIHPDMDLSRFHGRMVLFEERPGGASESRPGFNGFANVIGTDELLAMTRADARECVDADALLTARILDLLVGDRDRAIDNWRWAGSGEAGDCWIPIPRDRDQAFIQLDGLLKGALRSWYPRLTRYGKASGSVPGLTRVAWDLDRRFLSQVPAARWDSTAAWVSSKIDEAVIASAVARLPDGVPDHDRAWLANQIRERREALPAMVSEFQTLVRKEADLWATESSDSIQVVADPVGQIRVALYERGSSEPPIRTWLFHAPETHSVRIYALGGDDVTVVQGRLHDAPDVAIIGGAGADRYVGQAERGRADVYDEGVDGLDASGFRLIKRRVEAPLAWGPSENSRDFGSTTVPAPLVRYSSDFGATLGMGLVHRTYGLVHRPYLSQVSARAGWAQAHGRGYLRAEVRRAGAVAGRELRTRASFSGVERLRFYGPGNDTGADEPADVYRIPHDEFEVDVHVRDTLPGGFTLRVGPVFKATWTDTTATTRLLSRVRPYGSGGFSQVGARLVINRCEDRVRIKPVLWGKQKACQSADFDPDWALAGAADWFAGAFESRDSFGSVGGEFVVKVPVGPAALLAGRVVTRAVFGEVPFFHQAYLGGGANLRGFDYDRFAGDRSLAGNLELRVRLGSLTTPWFPLELGVLGLADAGRVWLEGDSPGGWHTTWGGGIWFAPVRRQLTFHAVAARGDTWTVQVGPSFAF